MACRLRRNSLEEPDGDPAGDHRRRAASAADLADVVILDRPITNDTGRVHAEARVVARGRQIISAEATVLSRDGKVLAHAPRHL